MTYKPHRVLGLFLVTVIIAFVGLVVLPTASAAEWGVDEARTPTGDWDQLGVGESQWYAFQYAGDGSQVQVTLDYAFAGERALSWTK